MGAVGATASGAGAGFSFGGPIGAIAGGLFGGISSIFSDAAAVEAMNEKISRAQALAATGLVDQDEIQDRLASIDRMFNQRLTSVLNTTAIRSRGFANQGTIGAAAAGQVEGARLTAQDTAVARAGDVNRNVRMSIAQMELQKGSSDPVGSFVQGASAGLTTGMEATKFFDRDEMPSIPTSVGQSSNVNQGQTGGIPMQNAGSYNPYLKQTQVTRLGSGQLPENYGMNWLPNVTMGDY